MSNIKTIKLKDGRELVFVPNPNNLSAQSFTITQRTDIDILGYIEGDYECDFDVEPFVEKRLYDEETRPNLGITRYKDYLSRTNDFSKVKDSFKSLMNANGLFMHNPVPKPIPSDYDDIRQPTVQSPDDYALYNKDINEWQKAQNRVVTKFVVLYRDK
jgi:hypothetical protein